MTWHFDFHDALSSTQDAAIEAARCGAAAPLAVVARRQTSGRGRTGRAWSAPEGNLSFSAVLRPAPDKLLPAAWSLLAGVAVFEAVASVLPAAGRLMLKWPNDLLLDGAKLAGVLIDSSLAVDGSVEWVVIGVGVNLAAAPEVPGRATACLAQAGVETGAEAMARLLAAELDRWQAAGFAAVRAAWLARAHPIGTRLRVQSGDKVLEGEFAGLTQDGRLRLDGAAAAASGDVEIIRGNAARA